MAQSGYTPIQLYNSSTPSAAPTAGNLAAGELAINTYDGVLYYKDSAGVVRMLASKSSSAGIFTSVTDSGLTSGRVTYAGTGGLLQDSTNLTFDGTTLTAAGLAGPHNGTVGATTPSTGAFTTLSASSTVSGTGFSTYLASPPAIGSTAANTGAFTTLSASSTVSGTGFSTYLASPPAIGGTTAAAITGTTITANTGFAGALNGTVGATTPNTGAFTTLSASSTVTLSAGTANGVLYLNGSKAATSGSALTFDGAEFKVNAASGNVLVQPSNVANAKLYMRHGSIANNNGFEVDVSANTIFLVAGSEQMRLNTTGLGIGTSSPAAKLDVVGSNGDSIQYRTSTRTIGIGVFGGLSTLYAGSGTEISFNIASEQMRLNTTGLGIGTSNPAYKLDVVGVINASAANPTGFNQALRTTGVTTGRSQIYLNNTSGDLIFGVEGSSGGASFSGTAAYSSFAATSGANPFYIITNSAIRATFDSSGNFGLGVTPSAWYPNIKAIEIGNRYGSISGGSGWSSTPNIAVATNSYTNSSTGLDTYIATAAATTYRQQAGSHIWYTAPSGTAGNAITFTQTMTLDADGTFRVKGAGTAGSTDAFQVSGSAPASAVSVGSNGDMTINGLTVGKGSGSVSSNTACGNGALAAANGGQSLDAFGQYALAAGPSGNFNSAFGRYAGFAITSGSNNVAVGSAALTLNTTGSDNTAIGKSALAANTTASENTAVGYQAAKVNTTGSNITAIGSYALSENTTGSNNVGIGYKGLYVNTTGSGNTQINPMDSTGNYVPVFEPTTQNNRFCMGSTGVTNAYIQVAWTVVSDARDKTEFAPVPHGLDFVNQLKPTAYRYKLDRESTEAHGPVRYGFKAQEVLALEGDNPVIVDAEDADKLRFNDQSLLAVLVNAIQEQQTLIESLTARINTLEGK